MFENTTNTYIAKQFFDSFFKYVKHNWIDVCAGKYLNM